MALLMSDTMLIDHTLHETLRLLDGLGGLTYTGDASRDAREDDGDELPA
jgi:hypothetical protein